MGYGLGPGMNKPGKKPVHDQPMIKPPTQKKPIIQQPKKPVTPQFPFDLGKLFGNKWQR